MTWSSSNDTMHHSESSGTQAAVNVDRENYSTHNISTFYITWGWPCERTWQHKKTSPPQKICFIMIVTMRNCSLEQNSDNLFIIDIAMEGSTRKNSSVDPAYDMCIQPNKCSVNLCNYSV